MYSRGESSKIVLIPCCSLILYICSKTPVLNWFLVQVKAGYFDFVDWIAWPFAFSLIAQHGGPPLQVVVKASSRTAFSSLGIIDEGNSNISIRQLSGEATPAPVSASGRLRSFPTDQRLPPQIRRSLIGWLFGSVV